jgi:hypothetical protein
VGERGGWIGVSPNEPLIYRWICGAQLSRNSSLPVRPNRHCQRFLDMEKDEIEALTTSTMVRQPVEGHFFTDIDLEYNIGGSTVSLLPPEDRISRN